MLVTGGEGTAVPIPGPGAAPELTLPREDDPTEPCTSRADSLPSSCLLKHRSLPLLGGQGFPLFLGAARQPPFPASRASVQGRQ